MIRQGKLKVVKLNEGWTAVLSAGGRVRGATLEVNITCRKSQKPQFFAIGPYNRAQGVFSMVVQNREGVLWKVAFIVVLVLGLSLLGCGNVDRGEAQVVFERGVRTYAIVPNTFQLQSDMDPNIVMSGEATKYTLVNDGRVIFTANDTTGIGTLFLIRMIW